jgi:hypothetical protein
MTIAIDQLMMTDVRTVAATSGLTASGATVVLDDAGQPCKLVMDGSAQPAVVVPLGTALSDLAADRRLVRTVTRTGVVVLDGDQVVGIVRREALVDALLLGRMRGGDNGAGSDPLLHGDPRPVSRAVRVRCLACRTVNAYDFYLPGEQKTCEQGHPLDPDLD